MTPSPRLTTNQGVARRLETNLIIYQNKKWLQRETPNREEYKFIEAAIEATSRNGYFEDH